MRALLLAVVVGAVGCTQTQDLGSPDPSTADKSLSRVLPPGVTLDSCPLDEPVAGAACALKTGFCNYHVDDVFHDRWCTCAVDGHWSCFSARNPRSTRPIEELPLDTVACAEGAPCSGGWSCSVGIQRSCRCTSAGRMQCQTVVAK